MSDHDTAAPGLPGTTPLTIAEAEESAATAPTGDDAPWATTFGAINVADHPTVAVARGEDVFPGGDAIPANGFAALDLATGAWQSYEGGLWSGADPGEARALALAGERLYVGGSLDLAGTVTTSSPAALDPATGRWEGFDVDPGRHRRAGHRHHHARRTLARHRRRVHHRGRHARVVGRRARPADRVLDGVRQRPRVGPAGPPTVHARPEPCRRDVGQGRVHRRRRRAERQRRAVAGHGGAPRVGGRIDVVT